MAGLALIISMGLTLFLGLIPPVEGEMVYSINRDGIWWCGGAAVGYPPTMIAYNDSNVDGACFGYLRFVVYSEAEAEDLFKACQ
ncbi:hypothetical protein Pmar_PMAR018229 [Perkinsus marinus ATCC 50983]|uniref:Uncharacterized protein n=1 Tax=Perkinsus marinus (strain ATCC 50983 / TXsc) TaxID=423536 RepID=C5KZ78_PERM5|nr:hypothetical protein Pmar_PMAR018229 [Perkinsus marinus ATCC 50983]EER10228.1 hypothetical protein Pmar_PMAR018229 [Perkinsus marinus ATCC 50983]|eukprot:XP_002778433.1 hypothetical protein Pmar_PMAR018229 [Perkinsus marinus ATCC 50983]